MVSQSRHRCGRVKSCNEECDWSLVLRQQWAGPTHPGENGHKLSRRNRKEVHGTAWKRTHSTPRRMDSITKSLSGKSIWNYFSVQKGQVQQRAIWLHFYTMHRYICSQTSPEIDTIKKQNKKTKKTRLWFTIRNTLLWLTIRTKAKAIIRKNHIASFWIQQCYLIWLPPEILLFNTIHVAPKAVYP